MSVGDDDRQRRRHDDASTAIRASRVRLGACARRRAATVAGAPERYAAEAAARAPAACGRRARRSLHPFERAVHMELTVERIASQRRDPARGGTLSLDALPASPRRSQSRKSHEGVCWPEFADLDWRGAGPRDRGAADAGTRSPGRDRLPVRDRGDRDARVHPGLRRCRRRRRCFPIRTSSSCAPIRCGRDDGGRVRTQCARRSPTMPRADQPDLRTVAHRRHRADDRARRPRSLPRAHPAARLIALYRIGAARFPRNVSGPHGRHAQALYGAWEMRSWLGVG